MEPHYQRCLAKANIMTHIGDGITGILALGQANIITKSG